MLSPTYTQRSHRTSQVFSGGAVAALVLAATLILAACDPGLFGGDDFSEEEVARSGDETNPLIAIDTPADGASYAPTVTVEGSVSDQASEGVSGQVSSASYELVGTTDSRPVELADDGGFSFEFSTAGITGTITVRISATDWNDNTAAAELQLVAPKEITSFAFLAEDNPELSQDAEAVIDGTDITVSVPDGTDLSALVASFETTGVSVAVGVETQESGATVKDFRDTVEYVVQANDGTTKTYTVTVGAAPLPPSNLQLASITADSIELSWTDNANNEDGYELQRTAGSGGSYAEIELLDPDTTGYTDSSFSGASAYHYRLRSQNAAGASAWLDLTVDVTPIAPTGLSITAVEPDRIDVSWTDNSSNEAGFRIERKVDGGSYELLATEPAGRTTYSDTAVAVRVEYTYRVRAVNDYASSGWSVEDTATTPLFTSGTDISSSAGGAASVFAADLDEDGDQDVLSALRTDDRIVWYENRLNNTGDFSGATDITSSASGAESVFAEDLDGDGAQDVLSASKDDDRIAWYENTGTGNYSGGSDITSSADYVSSVFATDLDEDGDADVLSASQTDNRVVWYENNGTGSFSSGSDITSSAEGAASVFATDLDDDGDADVLSASFMDDRIVWYENNGGGDFLSGNDITNSADYAFSVFAADLDGDGDADVLSASVLDNSVVWYENRLNEATGFSSGRNITSSANVPRSVYATDLDNDGDADVLSASEVDDRIVWYENNGGGDFLSGNEITSSADGAQSVYAIDLDNDGDADVLSASSGDNRIVWYENKLLD